MDKQIVILSHKLSETNLSKLSIHKSNNNELVSHINRFKNKLVESGDEVFNIIDNIIVTSSGYYLSAFADDLHKVSNNE